MRFWARRIAPPFGASLCSASTEPRMGSEHRVLRLSRSSATTTVLAVLPGGGYVYAALEVHPIPTVSQDCDPSRRCRQVGVRSCDGPAEHIRRFFSVLELRALQCCGTVTPLIVLASSQEHEASGADTLPFEPDQVEGSMVPASVGR